MIRRLRDSMLRWYLRTPEHPMKYRVVRWLGRNWFPAAGIEAAAHPDLRLRLHPQDWIEYLLLRGDRYEPLTLAFLAANLRLGDTAVLAGVNFGQHVAVAARAVGPSGRVVGIEPQPRALVKAWRNLEINRLASRVTLVSAALGTTDAIVPMAWSDPENAGAASLLDPGSGLFVPVLRLSTVIDAVAATSVRLLLLDVQGFETNVLAGMNAGAAMPDILVVEIDEQFVYRAGATPEGLLAQIAALGYHLRSLDGRPISDVSEALPERNVVGLRPGASAVWSTPAP